MGDTGSVVGIDHVQQLVDWSAANIRKSHGQLLDSEKIKLVGKIFSFVRTKIDSGDKTDILTVGDGRQGYAASAPYNAIHVGAAAPTLPQAVRGWMFE